MLKSLPPPAEQRGHYRGSIHSLAVKGLIVLGLFFGAGGLWAATAPLTGAVVAQGQMVVSSSVKTVQHPTGGVVAEVAVKDGQYVEANQLLIRLDETVTAATLAAAEKKIDELQGRAARLEAERFGFRPLEFPQTLTERSSNTDVAEILRTETQLYTARRDALQQNKSRLEERIKQLRLEIGALTSSRRQGINWRR